MIYSDSSHNEKAAFEQLLQRSAEKVLQDLDPNRINSGNKFENFVFEKMQAAALGTIFADSLYQTKDREFPDIIAKGYWGVEVKYTKDDKWKSIGNSVLESSRIEGVQKIYIFFGKCGGTPEIRYRLYESCLSGISVTHYPRYEIDMNLAQGESIFDKMQLSYDELRQDKYPVKKIRQFYKAQLKENDSLWWIDDNESASTSFQIQFFANLSPLEKNRLIAEGFILYPEILASRYAGLCAFWVSYYSIICPNMRDQYSAGGKMQGLSQIHYKLLKECATEIKQQLEQIDLALVADCWNMALNSRDEMIAIWYQKIDLYTPKTYATPLSAQFKAGGNG